MCICGTFRVVLSGECRVVLFGVCSLHERDLNDGGCQGKGKVRSAPPVPSMSRVYSKNLRPQEHASFVVDATIILQNIVNDLLS